MPEKREPASPPPSNASRRVSSSSLDGSISSFQVGSSDTLFPSFSLTSSTASCSISPSSASIIKMDMDIEMNDASSTLEETDIKLDQYPTPPPFPSQQAEQQIRDLVRGLQEEYAFCWNSSCVCSRGTSFQCGKRSHRRHLQTSTP